jgi:hypothetical protein
MRHEGPVETEHDMAQPGGLALQPTGPSGFEAKKGFKLDEEQTVALRHKNFGFGVGVGSFGLRDGDAFGTIARAAQKRHEQAKAVAAKARLAFVTAEKAEKVEKQRCLGRRPRTNVPS